MELFHEYRNKSVRAFMLLAERIANGEVFTKIQFETEYYKLSGDSKRITSVFYEKVIYDDKFSIFDLRDVKHVRLCEGIVPKGKIHIANIPLKTEKNWLNMALNDKLCNLFLSDEEISELGYDFSECIMYYRNIDDEWRKSEDISTDAAENFRMVLQAINEKKAISYSYNGTSCEGTPVKIEYDERKCKIYMIVYDGVRLIKTDITKLSDLMIKEGIAEKTPEIKEIMEKKKGYKPVVFTVTDNKKRKAIERALIAFSVYDHIVEQIDENTARFTIQYYSMDLDILIKDILAFGSDIIVESPKIVVNKIVEILKKV